jgi:hypothetical protein
LSTREAGSSSEGASSASAPTFIARTEFFAFCSPTYGAAG